MMNVDFTPHPDQDRHIRLEFLSVCWCELLSHGSFYLCSLIIYGLSMFFIFPNHLGLLFWVLLLQILCSVFHCAVLFLLIRYNFTYSEYSSFVIFMYYNNFLPVSDLIVTLSLVSFDNQISSFNGSPLTIFLYCLYLVVSWKEQN